jgi:hypothetical protein
MCCALAPSGQISIYSGGEQFDIAFEPIENFIANIGIQRCDCLLLSIEPAEPGENAEPRLNPKPVLHIPYSLYGAANSRKRTDLRDVDMLECRGKLWLKVEKPIHIRQNAGRIRSEIIEYDNMQLVCGDQVEETIYLST